MFGLANPDFYFCCSDQPVSVLPYRSNNVHISSPMHFHIEHEETSMFIAYLRRLSRFGAFIICVVFIGASALRYERLFLHSGNPTAEAYPAPGKLQNTENTNTNSKPSREISTTSFYHPRIPYTTPSNGDPTTIILRTRAVITQEYQIVPELELSFMHDKRWSSTTLEPTTTRQSSGLQNCLTVDENQELNKQREINLPEEPADWSEISKNYNLDGPGEWQPKNCEPLASTLVFIPFQSEKSAFARYIKTTLPLLIDTLQKQMLKFKIMVVEQKQGHQSELNVGKLYNAAFIEIVKSEIKLSDWDCVLFHEVDEILLDERISYACDRLNPVFLAGRKYLKGTSRNFVQKEASFSYVATASVKQFRDVNGFSNEYWGAHGHEDDMRDRLDKRGWQKEVRQTGDVELNWYNFKYRKG